MVVTGTAELVGCFNSHKSAEGRKIIDSISQFLIHVEARKSP